ncbi:MAG TPA: DUF2339 domain-containing protein [Thermoanaerobaculia bacterium]
MEFLPLAILVLLFLGLIFFLKTSDLVADPSPWVASRMAEEKRLFEPLLWLGGGGAAFLGLMAARLGTAAGWLSPATRAAAGLAIGLTLLGIGLAVRRRARLWQAAGFSWLVVTLASAVLLDGSLSPLLGLAFLAVTAAAALAVLGLRPGTLAVAMGAVGGAAACVSLDTRSLTGFGMVFLVFPVLLLFLVWPWGRNMLLALGCLGFIFARMPSAGTDLSWEGWTPHIVLVLGFLLLGRLEPWFQRLAWFGAGWGLSLIVADATPPALRWSLAALLTLGPLAAHRSSTRPAWWTALSAVTGTALFLLLAVEEDSGEMGWSGIAFAAGVLYLGGAWLVARWARAGDEEAIRLTVAPLAVATGTFAALAVALEIGRGWPGIAAALLAPFLMMLAARLRLPSLGGLALAAALFSLGWTILHARDFGYPGDLPWQLYGFGVPFLALAAAVWTGRRNGLETTGRMEWLMVLSGLLLATLLVRELAPGATTTVLVAVALVPLLAYAAWRLYRWRITP